MNFLEKNHLFGKVLKAFLLKKKSPLFVTWNITYRCNLQCKYCGAWKRSTEELSLADIFKIIDQLKSCGTKFITVSGGEPLLREDIGDIINYCLGTDILVGIKSNGILVKKHIDRINGIDHLQLSLDGPKEIQDMICGEGCYEKVIDAIEICKARKITVGITTVISTYNISHIPHILDIVNKYQIPVVFQPADTHHAGNTDEDISSTLPQREELREVINYLLAEKAKGNKFIENSTLSLKKLCHWPVSLKLDCYAYLIFCTIEPDGKMFICDMFPNYEKYLSPINDDFKSAFKKLQLPHRCNGCWCNSVIEFNLIWNLKFRGVMDAWNLFRNKLR